MAVRFVVFFMKNLSKTVMKYIFNVKNFEQADKPFSFLADDGQRQKKDKKIININFIIMVVGGVCVCVCG